MVFGHNTHMGQIQKQQGGNRKEWERADRIRKIKIKI